MVTISFAFSIIAERGNCIYFPTFSIAFELSFSQCLEYNVQELEDQVFDVLLLWAGPLLGSEFHIRQTQDLTSEIRCGLFSCSSFCLLISFGIGCLAA